jgi:hypothetical protein
MIKGLSKIFSDQYLDISITTAFEYYIGVCHEQTTLLPCGTGVCQKAPSANFNAGYYNSSFTELSRMASISFSSIYSHTACYLLDVTLTS